mmetsp:Transcript_1663/g.2499  ORF Transcript_1663/g.2499 Transcript_1663/m.2499 type:complete len:528 (+) Transcript_1663:235-1818(+)
MQQWKEQRSAQDVDFDETRKTLEAEYQSAQSAAAESVSIGRNVAESIARQGETLAHADIIADRNQYLLEKSARTLKGMTWSGWVANMFTSDVKAPPDMSETTERLVHRSESMNRIGGANPNNTKRETTATTVNNLVSISEYSQQEFPQSTRDLRTTVQNYHTHILLLQQCDSFDDQCKACLDVCTQLRQLAITSLDAFIPVSDREKRAIQWLTNVVRTQLETVYVRYLSNASNSRQPSASTSSSTPSHRNDAHRSELFDAHTSQHSTHVNNNNNTPDIPTQHQMILQAQDAHLASLSPQIHELASLSKNIHSSLNDQNEVLDALEHKTEDLNEYTKSVIRKTDQLTRRSQWTTQTPIFQQRYVTIQHLPTQRYLSIVQENTSSITLCSKFKDFASVFGVWKYPSSSSSSPSPGDANRNHNESSIRGGVIGLQNRLTGKWLGQGYLGNQVICSAGRFGKREEWEINQDCLSNTTMICANANWGYGGWIQDINHTKDNNNNNNNNVALVISKNGLEGKKNAASWKFTEI